MIQQTCRRAYTASRVHASLIVAITGGATWAAISLIDDPHLGLELPTMIRLTTLSAWIGGLVSMPFFGRDGVSGMVLAAMGACLSTALGAALAAGTFALAGVVFGPMFVAAMIVQSPIIATVWLVGMVAAHVAAESDVSPENSG